MPSHNLCAPDVRHGRVRASVRARWRSPDALYFVVWNQYSGINFDIPVLGGGTRSGLDKLYGKAFKLRNGNYLGWALAEVELSSQVLRGPLGPACSTSAKSFSQHLRVIVTPAAAGAGHTQVQPLQT
jgi:hypothetical protein